MENPSPLPVSIRPDDTIHELKKRIQAGPGPRYDKFLNISPNELEIWKCKLKGSSRKLSANHSFGQTKRYLGDFTFSGDEQGYSDAQHLGVTQLLAELSLESGELLFVLVFRKN